MAVLFVLALLGGVLFLLKRRGLAMPGIRSLSMQAGGSRRMEVVERVSLGPQHALHLVRIGERQLLVATAPSSCQLLDTGDRL
ncbi:MAG TPA: flagellar biosynthetic protein FliO [Bryobacteraceae bacterium]|nr:flagellar biosynthetic protein FliO [Bryobacteraceae bacterium]